MRSMSSKMILYYRSLHQTHEFRLQCESAKGGSIFRTYQISTAGLG